MSHDDFEKEPVPGLPARLPEGERILWQGKPDAKMFRTTVLHLRKLLFYFGVVFLWNVGTVVYDGGTVAQIALAAVISILLIGFVYALAIFFARAVERTTIYTLTNKRVVMRFGVALPITFNFPYSQIVTADVRSLEGGHGIIALTLKEHTKISWIILWPHARPWKLAKPQPAMQALPDVQSVAQILAEGLIAVREADQGSLQENPSQSTPDRTAKSRSVSTPTMGPVLPVAQG